jgi:hypothetical protein
MSTNRRTALARAAATKTWAVGMCDNFCANMYGFTASGYVDAVAHWRSLAGPQRHAGDTAVPAGMLAFWDGGHGHVAVSAGNGDVWSTDIAGAGTVARVPLSRIAADWGKPYLGWGLPVFQGIPWSEDVIKGYDVSGFQPGVFPTAGIDFVVIKITEGISYLNPEWIAQRETATAAGLVQGFYHFGRPSSEITAQADYFLSQIKLRPGDFIAFDWEDAGVSDTDKDAWISYVQHRVPGHRVLLYCNRDFWLNRDRTGFAGDGLWIADPDRPAGSPNITAPWLMHQYSEAGGYDHDIAQFSSRAEMTAWAGGTDVAFSAEDKAWLTTLVTNQANAGADRAVANLLNTRLVSPTDPAGGTRYVKDYIRWGDQQTKDILAAVAAAKVSGNVTPVLAAIESLAESVAALRQLVSNPAGFLAALEADLGTYVLKLEKETP